jgi:5-formyltetrahydrofolate cyclo-ligase
VATTVHDLQVVEDFPVEAIDQPLELVCTPTRTLRVPTPPTLPAGIDWTRIDEAQLDAMPLLAELDSKRRQAQPGEFSR